MDASARKLHEQASEVLGAQRRMQKSTSTPAREIRPIAFAACNATDSNIDRAADNEPGGRRAAQAREARVGAVMGGGQTEANRRQSMRRTNTHTHTPMRTQSCEGAVKAQTHREL